MNALIIHSAPGILIKEIIKLVKETSGSKQVFVMTFSRNKGAFSDCAAELYFNRDIPRINAYQVREQIKRVIKEKGISEVIGVYSNIHGSNYENLRVLLSGLTVKTTIYNRRLERVSYQCSISERLTEFYYTYEARLLPFISFFLKVYRNLWYKRPKQNNKVLLVNNTFTIGGIESLLKEWGSYLSADYQVSCACDTNGGLLESYQQSRIKTYLNRQDVYDEPCTLGFYSFLRKVFKSEKPSVVVIAGVDTIVPATTAAVISGVPLIIKIFNGNVSEIQNSRPAGSWLRLFDNLFDTMIAVSDSVKQNLLQLGLSPEKINVIYGTSVNLGKPNFRENGVVLDQTQKNIVCVSRLSPEKGVDVFLKAIRNVEPSILGQTRFHIVGDGPQKDSLISLTQSLNLEQSVIFWGCRNDVQQIIKQSYITILSSHTEGLPVSVLEAMALSKICIASKVGGTSEIIEHNLNGFLFEDNDYLELARLIGYCVENEMIVKEMEKKALQTIEQKFQIEVVMQQLKGLLSNLLYIKESRRA